MALDEATAGFRASYRAAEIGPRYSGWLHFAFTSSVCLAVVAICGARLEAVAPPEWLTVPAVFLYANLVEYLGKPRFTDDPLMKRGRPGVVMGLAWTPLGGSTLYIEAQAVPDKRMTTAR